MSALRRSAPLGAALRPHAVRDALAGLRRARRLQALPGWAARGFAAGVALDAALLAVALLAQAAPLQPLLGAGGSALRPLLDGRLWLSVLPICLAALATLAAALRRLPAERLAREVDARLALAERVSTALELESRLGAGRGIAPAGSLAALQRADALARLHRVDAAAVFPVQVARREATALGLALAFLLAFALLPHPTVAGDLTARAPEVARFEAERLSALADELAAEEDLPAAASQALAEALREAARELEREAESPRQAAAALSQAERSLAVEEAGADRELALARVADALAGADIGREVARRLGRQEYAAAAEELRRLGQGAPLAPDDWRDLAEALRRAARDTSRLDPALSDRLGAAAVDDQRREPALSEAAEELERAGREATSARMTERALAALQEARQSIDRAAAESGPARAQQPPDSAARSALGPDSAAESPGSIAERAAGSGPSAAGSEAPPAAADAGDGAGSPGGSGAGTGSLESRGETEREDFQSRQVRLPGGELERPEISPGRPTGEGPIGDAVVDYREVLPEYRERATRAMAQRYVPSSLKDLVRDYFSSLGEAR